MYFTVKERQILTELYRRLNYFHCGNLNEKMFAIFNTTEANIISKYNLITPTYLPRNKRGDSWYKLTEKGKSFFSHYIEEITEEENRDLFNGSIIKEFDFSLLPPQNVL